MGEREETGSDNRAFLDLYGTTLPHVERQNRGGGYREEGLSAPIEARSFLNGIELAQAYPDTNAVCAASQSW
jgi:hypothetical protein